MSLLSHHADTVAGSPPDSAALTTPPTSHPRPLTETNAPTLAPPCYFTFPRYLALCLLQLRLAFNINKRECFSVAEDGRWPGSDNRQYDPLSLLKDLQRSDRPQAHEGPAVPVV